MSKVGFAGNWENPDVFAIYEERRMFVTPQLEQHVQGQVASLFDEPSTILEIGAGGGALRRYAGDLPDGVTWIESDHNPDFLSLDRQHPSTKRQVELPVLPFPDNSLDGIVSLGVMDTLSTDALRATAEEAARTLSPGGVILHLLDMSPDYMAEISNSEVEGLFPLPFSNAENGSRLGLNYVALKNLRRRISRLPINGSTMRVFSAIVTDPFEYIPYANRTNILPSLGEMAGEQGMVVRQEPSWLDMFGDRLAGTLEEQGLSIIKNDIETVEDLVDDASLPASLRGRGVTHVTRSEGVVDIYRDDSGLVLPGKVKVAADMQIVAAQKAA